MQPDKNNQNPHEEQVQNPTEEQNANSNVTEKNYFEIVYSSVLGFFCAISVFAFVIFCLMGLGYWGYKGYLRWFSTDGMVKVGECGYYYSPQRASFYKVHPNRRILSSCHDLEFNQEDTIGIVRVRKKQYRYVNLNTLSFINDKSYYLADLFRDGRAMALANDTLHILSPDGSLISSEPSYFVYSSIRELTYVKEITDKDGDTYYKDVPTGVHIYEDANGNYGLMSADYTRLTPALYSDITVESETVLFAEYLDSGLGVLMDLNGVIIK